MSRMKDGFNRLFCGQNVFDRQLTLFSICGIIGLFQGYLALEPVDILWKYIFSGISILFTMFLTGYEIIFMKERRIPDIDMRSIKIIKNKIPFIVFLICIPLTFVSLFTKYQSQAFFIETLFAVPLSMMQAGFSYNFKDKDWKILFKRCSFTDYIILFLKRLWIIILAYAFTFTAIFVIFFTICFITVLLYKGDLAQIGFAVTSNEYAIKASATYITAILTVYSLTIGTLIWDYELIKTKEDANECL